MANTNKKTGIDSIGSLRAGGIALVGAGTVFQMAGIERNLKNSLYEADRRKDDIKFGHQQNVLEVENALADTWAGATKAIGAINMGQPADQITSNSTQQLFTIGGMMAEQTKKAELSIINSEINRNLELATTEISKEYMKATANAGKVGAIVSGLTQGTMMFL